MTFGSSTPRPAWKRKRPIGWQRAASPLIHDNVNWTRLVDPREKYRIRYIDRDGTESLRDIELVKTGNSRDALYLGVNHAGKFKTLRADRVTFVEQLSTGHAPSIAAFPTYATQLPTWTAQNAVFKIETTAKSDRTWTVDLNRYTCTCPEKRIRSGFGYAPGQLGFVCDHMAKAILANLPAESSSPKSWTQEGWTPELLHFLADPRKVHIDNLS